MKILTKRSLVILIMCGAIILGMSAFIFKYIQEAPSWATQPYNKHIYSDGKLICSGKIYDRDGEILYQVSDGEEKYSDSEKSRKALMHTIGDGNGNIVTSCQVAFGERLSGWGFVNGAYRFNDQLYGLTSDINLTLDKDLCVTAYNALNGRKGTVGVYNYKTGEILCMVSNPTFDPQNPPDISAQPERYEGVYINRLFSAAYTPGSVFKLVTAAAAIDNIEDIQSKTYLCEGEKIINGKVITCPNEHGEVNLQQALAKSCNVAFAEISIELGPDLIEKYAKKAGFNSSMKINGISTTTGKINLSKAKDADLGWGGIGQYKDTANPMCFMAYMGAVGNEGVCIEPRIKKAEGLYTLMPSSLGGSKRMLSKETAKKLGEMMRNDVTSEYGEGNYQGLELCAKSGTAQVGGDKEHSWFAGFLNREDYPLAFVVVIENGGSGSKVAGPVAGRVLKEAVRN